LLDRTQGQRFAEPMWVWSKLSSVKWQDAWEERFAACGGAVITTIPGRKTQRVEVYCTSRAQGLQIQGKFGGSLRNLPSRNWAAVKPERLPPVMVRDRLVISAESSAAELSQLTKKHPGRDIISVPPDLAFGTGHHATTATVLRLLVDFAESRKREGRPWTLLDLGTGTGVLAIAGQKLGARGVMATDNDPHSVRIAKANAVRNGAGNIAVQKSDVLHWKPRRQWDCVTANIFSAILEKAWPAIAQAMKPDGVVLVSGLLRTQAKECLGAAKASGIQFKQILKRGKWVTAVGVKQ
jgi:ribosomal protein L11 methyltransferase